ncbi:MAG: tetratricopeptide repeat protein [Proteobacteria bacterium]|nr:tetratricopeptide repeat protein [Pseudomonadota bacterium]
MATPGNRLKTEALLASAMQLHEAGHLAEAEKRYRAVLQQNPQHAAALYLLGLVSISTQKLQRGADLLARSIRLNPDFPPAYLNLGICLAALKRPREALAQYDAALQRQPEFVDAWYNRGVVLKQLGHARDALDSFDRALALRPGDVEALNNRGLLHSSLGRPTAALADFDRVVALQPDFAPAHCNRGLVFTRLRQPDQALASFNRAVALQPDLAEAWCNRGDALHELGRLEEAGDSFDKALALQPDLAEAHFGRSLTLLLSGRYPEGFREHEWRHRRSSAVQPRRLASKLWLGESSLSERSLLIHPELYLGDMVQLSRYALLARQQGARVVLAAQPPLRTLLASLHREITVVEDGPALPRTDLHCPLLSLPLAFGTALETVPASAPYLHADPALAEAWRHKLAGKALKVGICWQGHPARAELDRGFPLAVFAPLARVPGVRLVSLQTGAGVEQLDALPPGMAVEHYADTSDNGLRPFPVLAAMIANLDLVITTDTVVAHVAGALGRPAWVVLKHVADWRWGRSGTTTPWYPTLRLFRQTQRGDWGGVFVEVAAALAERAWNGG